ncbi:MAG: ABC transporter permease [Oscillospiraceae bacterium]|nr:ABC transporter permease [Oscillospiraceae bacterium]
MNTARYAFQVISHSRFRSITVFLLVFVTTVCVFGTALFTDNIRTGADRIYGNTGTDLYIVPQEYLEDTKDLLFKGKACMIPFKTDVYDKIAELDGAEAVSRQLYLETLELSCCAVGGLQVIAFDPETDFAVRKWTDQTQQLGSDEILAGSAGAFSVGETVDLFGRTFTVAGILEETGMGYDQSLFLTYEAADDITSSAEYSYMFGEKTGLVSMLLIRQKAGTDLAALTKSVKTALDGSGLAAYAIDDLTAGMKSNIRTLTAAVRIMNVFAVVIASVSLFAMVTLTFHQRRKTAGSLLSVGCTKGQILKLFSAEYLCLFVLGAAAGILLVCILLLPLHDVIKTALELPYKLISPGGAAVITAKTLLIDLAMLAAALSFTFRKIMKTEPALLAEDTL